MGTELHTYVQLRIYLCDVHLQTYCLNYVHTGTQVNRYKGLDSYENMETSKNHRLISNVLIFISDFRK